MKLIIEIEKEYFEMMKHGVEYGNDFKPYKLIANGTPLDNIISQIEQARDKDKIAEYPYNRCIEILRRAMK